MAEQQVQSLTIKVKDSQQQIISQANQNYREVIVLRGIG
jgi:hypothetical protein